MVRPILCQFLPDPRAVRRIICGLFLAVFFPAVALAQTLTVEMSRGPLEDERLREAVMLSTDWMQAAKRTGLDVRSVILRHVNETENRRETPQDIRRAKFLLREMGSVSGQTPLVVLFDPERTEKLAQLAAENLRSLGLTVRLVGQPEGARANIEKMMRSRTDISSREPGLIMLTWNFAQILRPVRPAPEIVRPERPRPEVVVPTKLSDLIVSEFQVEYDPGARVLTARALVRNIGPAETKSRFAVSFPESTGVIGDRMGRYAAGPLAPGGAQWVETRFRVDDAMLGRTVRLRSVADVSSAIRETNERNNQSVERAVFLERPAPPPPDLVIAGLQPSYDPLTRRLTIQVFVQNVGKSQAGPSRVRIVELQRLFGLPEVTLPAIAPGRSAGGVAEVIVPETALGQVARLQATVNADRNLPEVNFDNNSFGPVRVALVPPPEPDRPDLTISELKARFDPASGRIAVSFAVRNQGRGKSGPFEVGIFDQTGFVKTTTQSFAGLAPGQTESRSLSIPVQAVTTPRTIVLQAEADPEARVRESEEGNNLSPRQAVQLVPPPEPDRPDLTISELKARFDPASGRIEVSFAVRNQGRGKSGPFEVGIFDQTGFVKTTTQSFAGLAPGQTESRSLSIPVQAVTTPRTVVLQAEADPEARVRESEEGNNLSPRQTVQLVPPPEPEPPEKPDLRIIRLFAEHDAARNHVVLRGVVVNDGPVRSNATRVRFSERRNQMPDVDMRLEALAPGQRIIVHSETPVAPSPEDRVMEFVARVDVDARVEESREDNNESPLATLRIPGTASVLPDLAITSLVASHARMGAPLEVTAEIVNMGKTASRATEVALGFGAVAPVVEPLPALRPGEVYKLRMELPVPAALFGKTVEVSLAADPAGQIAEFTTANNQRKRQVALRASLWPWVAVAGVGGAALLLLVRLIFRSARGAPEPQPKVLPHLVRLRPRPDAGRQFADPEPGTPGIEYEFSLRPIRDSGSVTVEPLADAGEPDT
ncbi:CARDB domain-containing protein [Arenibacterium sp. CAU 1754]